MEAFFERDRSPAPVWAKAATILVLLLLFSLGCWWIFATTAGNWGLVWSYRVTFFNGWLLTLGLAASSLVLSTLIGVGAALARRASFLPLRYAAAFYIEAVRGLPLIVLVLAGFFGVANALQWHDRFTAGVAILSVFSGAYIAEIVRAGIDSIGRSQWDSARAIGLTPGQTYRLVIFPQVLRQSLPPLAGQFSSIIKDSSLLSIIGVAEVTLSAQQVASATYSSMACYLPLGILYLVLTLPISLWTKWLEKRVSYDS
jgi:polar amino acid transport system permease protein